MITREQHDAHKRWLAGHPDGVRLDLRHADLRHADLRDADLRDADMRGANLRGADLRNADLQGADIRRANLRDTNLRGANLRDTVLDPRRRPADATDALRKAGIPIHDGIAYGWRTRRSRYVVHHHTYTPVRHVAPWFSVCSMTDCHPGLYFASREWLRSMPEYKGWDIVPCATWVSCVCAAGDKFRTKELWVFDEADERWKA